MQRIKFRGKTPNGKWAFGFLLQKNIDTGDFYIREMNPENVPPRYLDRLVHPDTIGQFVGVTDKYGCPVYEGDYIRRYNYVYLVVRDDESACFSYAPKGRYKSGNSGLIEIIKPEVYYRFSGDSSAVSEVIGNIHENPELPPV